MPCHFLVNSGIVFDKMIPIRTMNFRRTDRTAAGLLAFARKTTAGSTEIANQSSDRKTKQPRLANKYYSSCWSASSSTAFTLPVCTETVFSFFPRKLSPRSLNTVASSKILCTQLDRWRMSSTPNRSPRPTHTLQNNTANTHIWCQLQLTMILNRHPAKFCNFNL